MLIIWDRLFGTYAEEVEPVVYGLNYGKPSANPLRVLFGGWLHLFTKIRRKLTRSSPAAHKQLTPSTVLIGPWNQRSGLSTRR